MLKGLNIPRRVIQAVLGHKNEDTTNRYLGVPQEEIYDAVKNLSMACFLPRA